MSDLRLEVEFLGMCTFVPDSENQRVWVFLVEGDADEQNRLGVPLHSSFVRFGAKYLVEGAPGNVLWRLNHCDLEVMPIEATPLEIECFDWDAQCCICSHLDGKSVSCFSWVAPVEDACAARGFPGGGELDRRFIRPKLTLGDRDIVGARMSISSGHLCSGGLQTKDDKLLISRFRPFLGGLEDGDLRQFTARSVKWVVKIPGDSITLIARDLSRDEELERVTLKPCRDNGQVIPITILNEEAELLVSLRSSAPFTLGMPRAQDRGFETVYSICATPPGPEDRPIPISERLVPSPFQSSGGGPIVDGAPPCNPRRLIMADGAKK